jgi:outer membrane protein OmpA-like peptidoglycan-associated protein
VITLAVVACGVSAAISWALATNDGDASPNAAATVPAPDSTNDGADTRNAETSASTVPALPAEPPAPTTLPTTLPASTPTSAPTTVAADQADAAADSDADDTNATDLQTGTDKLADAGTEDVLVLSLPTGEPLEAGELQPLTATIRGDNVYLEGTASNSEVGLDYEQQAIEIWGDKVVARYSIDSRAPAPRADDVVLEKPVLFEPGSATIDPQYLPVLDACFEFLTTYPAVSMVVEGHTDDVGSDEYNLQLAAQRADAIVAYYRSLGLGSERLVTVAAGEADPLADNATDEGREQNRRIDLSLVGALNATADDAEADAQSTPDS